jgi:excisionase family DNA binding protein
MEKLLTVEEVAVILRVNIHTVYLMKKDGILPTVLTGRTDRLVRFRESDIKKYINKQGGVENSIDAGDLNGQIRDSG